MAATRDKRSNAGARMIGLLEQEDEDDFYKTTYGGFDEEAVDDDYLSGHSDSADESDSDFSIDENDQVRSDVDDDDEPHRKKRVVTKAYKEPVKAPDKSQETKSKSVKCPVKEKKPRQQPSSERPPSIQIYQTTIDKKALRHSTAKKSKETEFRREQREARERMIKDIAAKRNVSDVRRLTQEELLREAKYTEHENLKSLERYHQLELEKKKGHIQKQVFKGPLIRYQSVTMPLIEELSDAAEISVDEDGEVTNSRVSPTELVTPPGTGGHGTKDKCSRTFITFTDTKIFRDLFPQRRIPKPAQKQFCPITRRPAKYFDPITKTAYATAQAFKIIREKYLEQGSKLKEVSGSSVKKQKPVVNVSEPVTVMS